MAVVGVARADLTAVVTPGYQFPLDGSVAPSYALLNLLANPVIQIYGTVGGSNTLAAGSVTGTQLSSSVADGISIGFNANNPPSLQVLAAGIFGAGLTNSGTSQLSVSVNPALTFQQYTNAAGQTNYFLTINTNWTYAQVWTPWTIYSFPTNGWFTNSGGWVNTNNAWGYTNITPITDLIVASNATPTLTATDTVPVLSSQQQNEPTTMTLAALDKLVASLHNRLAATVSFSAQGGGNTVVSNASILSMTWADASRTNTLLSNLTPVTATTNLFLTNLVNQLATAINGNPSLPQAQAVVSGGTNLQLYLPSYLVNPVSLVSVQTSTTTNLTATQNFTGAALTPLVVSTVQTLPVLASNTWHIAGGTSTTNFSRLTAIVAGGVPPYTYNWTVVPLATNAMTSVGAQNFSLTNTAAPIFNITLNPAGAGSYYRAQLLPTVTDAAGQSVSCIANNNIITFFYP